MFYLMFEKLPKIAKINTVPYTKIAKIDILRDSKRIGKSFLQKLEPKLRELVVLLTKYSCIVACIKVYLGS